MSLRNKLALFLLVLTMTPMAFVGAVIAYVHTHATLEDRIEHLKKVAYLREDAFLLDERTNPSSTERLREERLLGETGEIFFVTRGKDGGLTLQTPPRFSSPQINPVRVEDLFPKSTEAFERKDTHFRTTDYREKEVLVLTRNLSDGVHLLILKIDIEEALASVRSLENYFLILAFILSACSIVAALMISKSLTDSLASLTVTINRFGAGNQSLRSDITSHDEAGIMAQNFNRMANSVESASKKIEKSKKEIEARLKEIDTLNKTLIGRELKMIELKNEIKKLQLANPKKKTG